MIKEMRREENVEGEVDVKIVIQKQFNKAGIEYGSTIWMQNDYIGQEDEEVVCIKDYETMKCDNERYYFKLKDKVVFVDFELDYISVL